MKPLPHHYDVRLAGGPDGYATSSADRVPELLCAAPADFDGPGDAWSPEYLLLGAVQTCFLFTTACSIAGKVSPASPKSSCIPS